MLIDGPVQIAPLAADLNVGLVNPNRSAMRPAKLAKTLLDRRRIAQYPAVDRAVIDLEAPLCEHFFQISITQRISQILESVRFRLNHSTRLKLLLCVLGMFLSTI